MADTYTETTSRSWGSRMMGSFTGVLFGILLFFGAFVVLWMNEGRSVQTAQALAEMEKTAISLSAPEVATANEGKLIHVSGPAKTAEVLNDPTFGVSANVIKLVREVEMYQWDERSQSKTREKLGGGEETVTTYTYEQKWSSTVEDSAAFKKPEGHSNPEMLYQRKEFAAGDVVLGGFKLSPGLIARIDSNQDLTLTQDDLAKLRGEIASRAQLGDGYLYIGKNGNFNPTALQVGDYRIRYRIAPAEMLVSIIAKQVADSFEPYQAKNGRAVELLQTGAVSVAGMIAAAEAENKLFTWILRLVGFLMIFIGLVLILKPLATAGAVIPFLGQIIGAGSGIIAFMVALSLSLVTIALAWVAYRPFLGIGLLILALAVIFLAGRRSKKMAMAQK